MVCIRTFLDKSIDNIGHNQLQQIFSQFPNDEIIRSFIEVKKANINVRMSKH